MIGDVYLVHKPRTEQESRIISKVRRALDSKNLFYREKEKLRGRIEVHTFDLLVPPNGHPGLAIGIVSGQNTRSLATDWYFKCDDVKLTEENGKIRLALVYDVGCGSWSDTSKSILADKADAVIPSDSLRELPERFQSLVTNVH